MLAQATDDAATARANLGERDAQLATARAEAATAAEQLTAEHATEDEHARAADAAGTTADEQRTAFEADKAAALDAIAVAEAALAESTTARDVGLETEKTLRAKIAEARNPPIIYLVFYRRSFAYGRAGGGSSFVRFGAHVASGLASVRIVRARVRARLRARARRRG